MELGKYETIRGKLSEARTSPLRTYLELTVGDAGARYFMLYEFVNFVCGSTSGGLGLLLRRNLYPLLLQRTGRAPIFGRNVSLRHPRNIAIGDAVTIDDYSVVDARGAGPGGISVDDQVIINRNCVISAKAGPVRLGRRTTIGGNSVIVSLSGVDIGEAVIIANNCTISAGAYPTHDLSRTMLDQGAYSKGPIRIEDDVWIGTGAMILGNVTVQKHAIVAAGAVVTKDVPQGAIVGGVPAKVLRHRTSLADTGLSSQPLSEPR